MHQEKSRGSQALQGLLVPEQEPAFNRDPPDQTTGGPHGERADLGLKVTDLPKLLRRGSRDGPGQRQGPAPDKASLRPVRRFQSGRVAVEGLRARPVKRVHQSRAQTVQAGEQEIQVEIPIKPGSLSPTVRVGVDDLRAQREDPGVLRAAGELNLGVL